MAMGARAEPPGRGAWQARMAPCTCSVPGQNSAGVTLSRCHSGLLGTIPAGAGHRHLRDCCLWPWQRPTTVPFTCSAEHRDCLMKRIELLLSWMGPHTGRRLLQGATLIVSIDCFQMTGQKNLLDPLPSDGSCKEHLVRSPAESAERGSASVLEWRENQILEPGQQRGAASLLGSCRWNPQCCIAELSAPWLLSFPVIFPGK